MRFADWIISCSLEVNNGCLRFLADSQARGSIAVPPESEDHTLDIRAIYTEPLLARDTRRVVSHWRLVQPTWAASEPAAQKAARAHVLKLVDMATMLTHVPAPVRLAMRLASQATDDKQAKLMLSLARSLPGPVGPEWASLNDLFTHDSALWRNPQLFREVDDELVSKRLAGAYRRGYRMAKGLKRGWIEKVSSAEIEQVLGALLQSSQIALHGTELLRSVLSDKHKHQLWHLDKFVDALRMRHALRSLRERARQVGLAKKKAKRARKYLATEEIKANQKIDKLLVSAFMMKPKKYGRKLLEAVDAMDLASVSSVNMSRVAFAELPDDATMQNIVEESETG